MRSIKRRMGSSETVQLGDKSFTPQEISALILRELTEWAGRDLQVPVKRAVITVPAYFSDAQRNATREAGMMAGLEVVRILNEPTAASLAYGFGDGARRTVMVYDLGGGTFDVSVVMVEGDVTEVLASHGNNHLGGDDFDDLLLEQLQAEFHKRHGMRIGPEHPLAMARLWWAAEAAKKQLSFQPYAQVREEALITVNGKPLHLDLELSREEYERMILPLVESTLDSVSKALQDAGRKPRELDAILLVGGSTRTPLVSRLLRERTGLEPRQDVHPDLCVALGAGVLASRLAGRDVERVLVDVSPYSFGPSLPGRARRSGVPVLLPPHHPPQYAAAGDAHRELLHHLSGTARRWTSRSFRATTKTRCRTSWWATSASKGLAVTDGPNEVMCRMSLDVDGILHVAAIEKRTGKSKHITIANAMQAKSDEEMAAARQRITELYESREQTFDEEAGADEDEADETLDAAPESEWDRGVVEVEAQKTNGKVIPMDTNWVEHRREAVELIQRSRRLLDTMHAEDKEEAVLLTASIEAAVAKHDSHALVDAIAISQGVALLCGGQLMCPVCQARFRGSAECSRCGADLGTVMALVVTAWRLREAARQAIGEGDMMRASALAAQAQELCRTPAGRDLEMVAGWLEGPCA